MIGERPVEPKEDKLLIKKKKKFELKKALFILPNAFTTASIFCGIYAILKAVAFTEPESLFRACVAVFFAGFFDMFDGRIARLTKTQSDFGVEYDSLADVVSFGVAPAIIVYSWALSSIGPLGMLASISFVACGAIRLARFNVLSRRAEKTGGNFFTGLPIPVAASMLVAMIIAHFRLFAELPTKGHYFILALVFFLAFLMVSTIEFWSFKNVKLGRPTIFVFFALAIIFFLSGIKYHISITLLTLIGSYILAGIVREFYMYFKYKHK